MTTTVAMYGSRDSSTACVSWRRHAPRDEDGAMEYPCGWTQVQAYGSWDEERLPVESELELQIWRWALLEAHLWEASHVYESLMDSPFAPRTRGGRMHHDPEGWYLTIDECAGNAPRRSSGRSQGRRQRRRTLQRQRRSSQLPRQDRSVEQVLE